MLMKLLFDRQQAHSKALPIHIRLIDKEGESENG